LIVVDASLVVSWLLGEKRDSGADHLFDAIPDGEAIAPAHWPIEIANALRSPALSGRLSPADFLDIMDDLDKLNVDIEPAIHLGDLVPLAQFAVAHGLTAYDAAYVQLAFQRKAILATLDDAMRRVAQRLDIALLPA
jgi:predicted nucleic acid-binding protein